MTDNQFDANAVTLYGDAYTWAAIGLSHPQQHELVADSIRIMEEINESLEDTGLAGDIALLHRFSNSPESELIELKKEHSRLFVGPFSLPAPPYESYYLEGGTAMGSRTLRVRQCYKELGFEISPHFKDAPDHIVLEIEFMALLCELEREALGKNNLAGVQRLRSTQEQFLGEHLLQWLGAFRRAVEKGAASAFYPVLARTVEITALRHYAALAIPVRIL